MSDFIDKAKDLAKDLTDKARGAVGDHADTIRAASTRRQFVDEKTKGKYADKIETVRPGPRGRREAGRRQDSDGKERRGRP